MFTSMFTCARTAGWCAHILEQKRTGRLVRPSARYIGPGPRKPEDVEGWDTITVDATTRRTCLTTDRPPRGAPLGRDRTATAHGPGLSDDPRQITIPADLLPARRPVRLRAVARSAPRQLRRSLADGAAGCWAPRTGRRR